MTSPDPMRLEEFIDWRFGFPVILRDVPVRQVRGEVVPDVNAAMLREAVLAALVAKPARLTGAEVRFIRLALEMPMSRFGTECGVSHAAVGKWESKGAAPTNMALGTEFYIRVLVLEKLPSALVAAAMHASDDRGLLRQLAEVRRRLVEKDTAAEISVTGDELATTGWLQIQAAG